MASTARLAVSKAWYLEVVYGGPNRHVIYVTTLYEVGKENGLKISLG
jgi:hypothetical protein